MKLKVSICLENDWYQEDLEGALIEHAHAIASRVPGSGELLGWAMPILDGNGNKVDSGPITILY